MRRPGLVLLAACGLCAGLTAPVLTGGYSSLVPLGQSAKIRSVSISTALSVGGLAGSLASERLLKRWSPRFTLAAALGARGLMALAAGGQLLAVVPLASYSERIVAPVRSPTAAPSCRRTR